MKYTLPKPTQKQIKLLIAAIFFTGVFIRYNQQRPALKQAAIASTGAAQVSKPDDLAKPKSPAAANKPIAESQVTRSTPPGQKRYYLLDTPNDTYYNSTWYMQNVRAPSAWDVTNSSSDATVAVIDSGFALSHQDLANQWKLNSGESGGGKETDGVDNDHNGYVDDYRGWDFANNDNQPQAGTLNSNGYGVSHGTETAGLAGASSNNGVGVSSVARNVRLLPLQVMDDNGNGFSDDVAEAIIYAISQGATVINMSLGTSGDDPVVRAAVDIAFEYNVVVVAAAGNCGSTSSAACAGQVAGYVTFPANYNRVIAVGATDRNNNRASFSSYGERLDIMAPGSGSLYSTTWSGNNGTSLYAANLFGTSYASPIVASSAALIRSIRPNTSIDDVRALLMASAQKLGPMSGAFYSQSYGHGLLDIGRSIQIANELNSSGESAPSIQQSGATTADHIYSASDTLGAGCAGPATTWCTIWLRNASTNYERFLPYTMTSSTGLAGWNFAASSLNKGDWSARARQGDIVSSVPYELLKK